MGYVGIRKRIVRKNRRICDNKSVAIVVELRHVLAEGYSFRSRLRTSVLHRKMDDKSLIFHSRLPTCVVTVSTIESVIANKSSSQAVTERCGPPISFLETIGRVRWLAFGA